MNSGKKTEETFSKGKQKNPSRVNFKINRCKHEKLQLRVNQTSRRKNWLSNTFFPLQEPAIISRSTWFCTFNNYLLISPPFSCLFMLSFPSSYFLIIPRLHSKLNSRKKSTVECDVLGVSGKKYLWLFFLFHHHFPTPHYGCWFYFLLFRHKHTTPFCLMLQLLVALSLSMLSCFSLTEKCHH